MKSLNSQVIFLRPHRKSLRINILPFLGSPFIECQRLGSLLHRIEYLQETIWGADETVKKIKVGYMKLYNFTSY